VALVQAYQRRIAAMDQTGPTLRSLIALNPHAIEDAKALDAERRGGRVRGPLHGVPLVIKDNIETRELPTTAGSLALKDNFTGRDAPAVARLRAAGVIVLAKANLSEWAQFRDRAGLSGWSPMGGLTVNPYALDRSACGSSSGTGAAVAASFAAAGLGTETNASIICPAANSGLVGLKPTVGLVSRTHLAPLSPAQDTAGPMTRTVADAAALLTVMAGSDPDDPATAEADRRKADYLRALEKGALKGARIGVVRPTATVPGADAVFEAALKALRAAGAVLVEVEGYDEAAVRERQLPIFLAEFGPAMDAYLATLPPSVKARTLSDLIAFNKGEPRETALSGQDLWEKAVAVKDPDGSARRQLVAEARRMAGPEGIDRLLKAYGVEALVMPSGGPAAVIDLLRPPAMGGSATTWAAVAGYPHLTVPMGQVRGLPVGLSLIGPAWSEGRLLALGFAFEQATQARQAPTYAPSVQAIPSQAQPFMPAGQARGVRAPRERSSPE